MAQLVLPVLGKVTIKADPKETGHYLWWNRFGWSDCNPLEDRHIAKKLASHLATG